MNHKARRLILHFGLPKTGTSALQHTLFVQRAELLKQHRTLYPGKYENHFFLQAIFSKQPESLLQIQRLNLGSSQSVAIFLKEYYQELLDEINMTQPHQIILSSEYFVDMSTDELKTMHEFLKSVADEVVLFAYVRDPWSWSISLAQEHIRTGRWKKEVKIIYRYRLREIFNKLEDAFGMRAIAAPYIQRSGSFNVVTDFGERFGINSLLPNVQQNKTINHSMLTEATCMMLQLNQFYPVFDDHQNFIVDPVRDWMAEAIQNSPLSKTQLRISTSTAQQIYEKSKADIDFVEERYFSGRKYFTELYNTLQTTDLDDTLSISIFTPEQLSEYLLSCMYTLSERAVDNYKSRQSLSAQLEEIQLSKAWKIALFLNKFRAILAPDGSRRYRLLRRLKIIG